MAKKLIGLAAGVLALLVLSSGLGPAEARRAGWSGGSHHGFIGARSLGVRHYSGKAFHFRHAHHFRGRRLFIGAAPLAYGAYYYGGPYSYGDGCYWLKRRARATGSSYWWDRYYACIYDYGY
jgi:hypothetical protein